MADFSAQDLRNSKAFLGLSPNDQTRFLQAHSPAFKGLSAEDQAGFLAHVTNQPEQETKKEGFLSTLGSDLKGMLPKMQPYGDHPLRGRVSAAVLGGEEAQKNAEAEDASRRNSGYGTMYRATAPIAEGLGVNVPGMEESARKGDVEGVMGHAAAVPSLMAAGEMVGNVAPALGRIPGVGRVAETAGKVLANQSIERPFKAASKLPEYWRETSPEGRMLSATRQAVKDKNAAWIPMRVRGGATTEGMTSPSSTPPTPEVTHVPEPRQPFPGENEGYMASVPRPDLNDLALMRKPGAGRQLQQLGRPIIYIPKEADLP